LVIKKLPQLKSLDAATIPQEKQGAAKLKILEAKFSRQREQVQGRLGKIVGPLQRRSAKWAQGLQEKVITLERKYKRGAVVEEARTKSINELLTEAKVQKDGGDFVSAEKSLIEVIARDKKNRTAYELLAEVYRLNRHYDQAEEVLRYLIKLASLKYRHGKNPENLKRDKIEDAETAILERVDIDVELARYYDDLAKIYEALDKKDKALDCYLKANAIEPNNPKFLDKVIDLALVVGDSAVDVQTARNAGLKVCGVSYGFQPESFAADPPDMIVDRPEELARAVIAQRRSRGVIES